MRCKTYLLYSPTSTDNVNACKRGVCNIVVELLPSVYCLCQPNADEHAARVHLGMPSALLLTSLITRGLSLCLELVDMSDPLRLFSSQNLRRSSGRKPISLEMRLS